MEDVDNNHTEILSKINSDYTSGSGSFLPNMANYPDVEVTVVKNKNLTDASTATGTKVNGESAKSQDDKANSNKDEEELSADDVLVIDEERYSKNTAATTTNRKRLLSPSNRTDFKGFKKRILCKSTEVLKTVIKCVLQSATQLGENKLKANEVQCDEMDVDESNSQCELDRIGANTKNIKHDTEITRNGDNETPTSTDHKCNPYHKPVDTINEDNTHINPPNAKPRKLTINKIKSADKKTNKKSPSRKLLVSPKLTEYTRYLGLQSTVKFKCYKCSESTFPSMSALKEHQQQCLVQRGPPTAKLEPLGLSEPSLQPSTTSISSPTSTKFRVTRKVYLCSACGTYYENWNLFLHMREVHRRFICLYCLGMFSLVEKLSQHLNAKHNCIPRYFLSAEEYLSTCKEACLLMCCHCERVFTEQDNFFDHICTENATTNSNKACRSCETEGIKPHLPSCKASKELPSTNNQKANKILNQKSSSQKQMKSSKKKIFANIEHVTADSPSNLKSLLPRFESEQTCDIANLCKVDMDRTADKSLPISQSKTLERRTPNLTDKQWTQGVKTGSEADVESTEKLVASEGLAVTEEKDDTVDKESRKKKEVAKAEEDKSDTLEADNSTEVKSKNEQKIKINLIPSVPTHEKIELEPENIYFNNELCFNELVDIIKSNKKETTSDHESEKDGESDRSINMETKIDKLSTETDKVVKYSDQHSIAVTMNINNDAYRNLNVGKIEMDVDNNLELEKRPDGPVEEMRRVPKVTLKLPPPSTTYPDNESDNSEKLMMAVEDNEESEQGYKDSQENNWKNTKEQKVNGNEVIERGASPEKEIDGYPIAGDDISIVKLELDQPLDKFTTENLIKTCLNATVPTCVYCNHARKIAVNGKQLGLHAIAEHRFSATVNSITAEELIPYNFVVRIKDGVDKLEDKYFNLEIEKEKEHPSDTTFKREYECLQCRYVTVIHKELYLHNRKMHAKTILLCIICKSNFCSYSEIICHLCPGNYALNNELKFRCCMCDIADLPSAFRLMVHLRKKHHTCDVCFEGCQNQSRLSNHVWKHKLHHFCYRCGISYRNKPDITKHLFWKHGTESVMCKKCLQKKWSHIYHFCTPPIVFVCEECNSSFSHAVYLKVHKRLHSNEKKHTCSEEGCTESFVSKKLLLKHEKRHRQPDPVPKKPSEIMNRELLLENNLVKPESLENEILNENEESTEEKPMNEEEKKQKNIPDIYNLPALNLSESDSDDSEDEAPPKSSAPTQVEPLEEKAPTEPFNSPQIAPNPEQTEKQKPVQIVDGMWDNFKHCQAIIEKRDISNDIQNGEDKANIEYEKIKDKKEEISHKPKTEKKKTKVEKIEIIPKSRPDLEVILVDHDYFMPTQNENKTGNKDETTEMDHNYCSMSKIEDITQKEVKLEDDKEKNSYFSKKKKALSSNDCSSDSDSSSCTCGSNCSCSSTSGSSSSSSSSSDSDNSSSEEKRKITARRVRRKERTKRKKENEIAPATNISDINVVVIGDNPPPPIIDLSIKESDLDTDETETDEDFYDEHPQRFANKILEEKRNQLTLLTAITSPVCNNSIVECSRPSTPSVPEEASSKKKIKSKKYKKKTRSSTPKQGTSNIPTYNHQQSPLTIQTPSITKIVHRLNISSPTHIPPIVPIPLRIIETAKQIKTGNGSETYSNVRSSKRRRVPNKFYGYSSDDETSKKSLAPPILKWRKADKLSTPTHLETASPKYVSPITIKNIPASAPVIDSVQASIMHRTEVNDSDSEPEIQPRKSSSDSSNERNDDFNNDGQLHFISQPQFPLMPVPQVNRTNENLYCYCQCPYDEVSEMIACDGRNCAIEWFHFECVGIIVPPKGKWFCPECRKKYVNE